jgi:hypothetical protein
MTISNYAELLDAVLNATAFSVATPRVKLHRRSGELAPSAPQAGRHASQRPSPSQLPAHASTPCYSGRMSAPPRRTATSASGTRPRSVTAWTGPLTTPATFEIPIGQLSLARLGVAHGRRGDQGPSSSRHGSSAVN